MTSQKKSGCLPAVLFLLLCLSILGNFVLLILLGSTAAIPATTSSSSKIYKEVLVPAKNNSSQEIAQIDLLGLITSDGSSGLTGSMVDDFKHSLKAAVEEENVKGILIRINSPGGEVTASDVLYNAIQQAAQKKPVLAYIDSIGASGGYYAACGSSYIMANDTAITGSIGVIIQTFNYQSLLGKVGLEAIVFKSGKFKDMLSGSRNMTQDEITYVQGLVDQSYDRFLNIVAESRELEPSALRNTVADGRILTGVDAKTSKLVDNTGYIEDAYTQIRTLAEAPDAKITRYAAPLSFANFFSLFNSAKSQNIQLNILPESQIQLKPATFYFLPSIYLP